MLWGDAVLRGRPIHFGAAVALLALGGVLATVVLVAFGLDGAPPGPPPAVRPAVATPSAGPGEPSFPIVTRTAAQLAGGRADLYVPLPGSAGRPRERYPLAVLLADPRTDPTQYEQLAHEISRYGITVLVTDRPADAVLPEVRGWTAAIDDDPRDYLHGLVASSVSFVVAHDTAEVSTSTWDAVRAVALLTPSDDVVVPSTRRAPVLVVCGDHPPATASCDERATDIAQAVVAGAVPLSVTDQGRRSPRVPGEVSDRRLRTISEFARTTAPWLLAHNDSATT